MGSTGDFAVLDQSGSGPDRHAGHADVEVPLPGGQDERAQARLAVAMGWPLEVAGSFAEPADGASRCRARFPVDLPGGDQQMTLVVSLPLLARWGEPRQRAVIGEILGRLDRAGIAYKLIQIAATGVLYLPKTGGKKLTALANSLALRRDARLPCGPLAAVAGLIPRSALPRRIGSAAAAAGVCPAELVVGNSLPL